MTIEDLKRLPVATLAADDAVLFMWATYPFLREAFDVIDAWGFKYKTIGFVWVKRNKSDCGFFFGLGRWTRSNAEPCLLAVRGSPKRVSAMVSQLLFSPLTKHSRKPVEARHKIVELMGDVPRVELFARQQAQGWDVWGNEVDSTIELSVAG